MTHPSTHRIAVATAAGCLLLAGCNSHAKPPAAQVNPGAPQASDAATVGGSVPAAGSSDRCSLLTQAEVDTAVGQPLGAGKPGPIQGCSWATSDFAAGVDLTVNDWTGLNAAAHGNGATPTSLSGLGDEALNLNGSNGSLLYVRKGDSGFLLTINGPHIDKLPDHGLAQEKVLAAAALGRL